MDRWARPRGVSLPLDHFSPRPLLPLLLYQGPWPLLSLRDSRESRNSFLGHLSATFNIYKQVGISIGEHTLLFHTVVIHCQGYTFTGLTSR